MTTNNIFLFENNSSPSNNYSAEHNLIHKAYHEGFRRFSKYKLSVSLKLKHFIGKEKFEKESLNKNINYN